VLRKKPHDDPTLKICVEYPLTHHRGGLFRDDLSLIANSVFFLRKVVKNMSTDIIVHKFVAEAGGKRYRCSNLDQRVRHDIGVFPNAELGR
jgi:hypothetical protein